MLKSEEGPLASRLSELSISDGESLNPRGNGHLARPQVVCYQVSTHDSHHGGSVHSQDNPSCNPAPSNYPASRLRVEQKWRGFSFRHPNG